MPMKDDRANQSRYGAGLHVQLRPALQAAAKGSSFVPVSEFYNSESSE